ncbi:SDR family NAD(P)-dependent oxidoreductase [Streptomyces sp. NPDC126933]|uniref:SDR family NAD(P)-dependent oxidoreductase n=1 Tax=unclassified Streptomyces TaxID=2593676 RepID=UPI0036656CB3
MRRTCHRHQGLTAARESPLTSGQWLFRIGSAPADALASFTRTWAAEFSPGGVRVNSVAPGPTVTEGVLAEWGDGVAELGEGLPLRRTATPTEIAEAILFLASPRSSYVTGSTLAVDGGATAI